MNADVLRDAAVQLRAWWPDCECHAAERAVADWLDNAAEDIEMQSPSGDLVKQWDMRIHINGDKGLAVARAYLGDQP